MTQSKESPTIQPRRTGPEPGGTNTIFENKDATSPYRDFSECEGCPDCNEGRAVWVAEGVYSHEGAAWCRVTEFIDAWPKATIPERG